MTNQLNIKMPSFKISDTIAVHSQCFYFVKECLRDCAWNHAILNEKFIWATNLYQMLVVATKKELLIKYTLVLFVYFWIDW